MLKCNLLECKRKRERGVMFSLVLAPRFSHRALDTLRGEQPCSEGGRVFDVLKGCRNLDNFPETHHTCSAEVLKTTHIETTVLSQDRFGSKVIKEFRCYDRISPQGRQRVWKNVSVSLTVNTPTSQQDKIKILPLMTV